MLVPLFLIGLCSFCLSIVLTPLCRDLFRRLGIVDLPDQARKKHVQAVPHMGGVPIALAYGASCLLLVLFPPAAVLSQEFDFSLPLRLMPAVLVVFLTGVLDDVFKLRPWEKLVGQALGAVCAYMAGVRIGSVASHPLGGGFGLLITVVWLIGCCNAFNLIDGVDGLASGVGLFATTTTLIAALLQNNVILAIATAPLAGALLGFLRYNFNPASIFLGDSGSLSIGFLLGCFGVVWSQKSATILGMTAPLMALAIPLVDTGLSVFRRFMRHQPIFAADSDHIHHRLLKRGLTPKGVAIVLYGIAALGASFSLVQSVVATQKAGNQMAGLVIVVFCAATWIGIQHLGYTEFGAAKKMLLAGDFRQALDAQLRLLAFNQQLLRAESIEECWEAIIDAGRAFGFVEARLCIADRVYYACLRETNGDPCWSLRVPLLDDSSISFTRAHESPVMPMGVTPFVDIVRSAMTGKCREFAARSSGGVVAGITAA